LVYALCSPENIGVKTPDEVEELFIDLSLNYQKMKNAVEWIRIQETLREGLHRFRYLSRYKPRTSMDRAMTATATPMLNEFSEDLTVKAGHGALFPCIGREKEFERIFRIFEGSREGVLLLGPRGVGKTAIIEGLAQRMVTEDVPDLLQDKRLVSLDLARLVAGADAAMAEERLLMIAGEVIRSGNIILVVENLSAVSGIASGGAGSLDLSEVLSQIISRHQFHCLATASAEDFSKFIEPRSLGAEFQPVKVEEMEMNDAICVLEAKSGPIEYENEVFFSYDAIEKTALLSSRYIHDRYLPEKGIEILEQSAIKVRDERGKKKIVTGEDVAAVISAMTSIPVTKVTENESQKLLNMEEKIHERMVGQDEAVKIVSASLRRARAELREGKRPIASLLFLGPTGVGKTELAKTVSEVYFNSEESMLRFDMSEYQEQSSIGRLLGQGSNPGQLTEQVRKKPFSMVLFDEVEKAHPDILNLFLQLMDDGRLTDAQGRTIDFTNTIVIMTSNAGAQAIQDQMNAGVAVEKIKNNLINEQLREHFRPEFLNRFDGIVVFKPLSMVEVIKIARLMVKKIAKRLDEKGIEFTADDEAIAELAEMGFDPKFGARPLRRVIQERIDDVLAEQLLGGNIERRDKVILQVGGKLKVEKAEMI
jgi:ATP-dependent Clp protease ATP-binding subunit ClpC